MIYNSELKWSSLVNLYCFNLQIVEKFENLHWKYLKSAEWEKSIAQTLITIIKKPVFNNITFLCFIS